MSDAPRLRWIPILLEAFFVVLGVVLALSANEWRERRNRTAHAQTALASIRQELAVNRDAVASALDYHLTLSDTLRRLARQGPPAEGPAVSGRLFSRGYVAPADLLETAWEAANATDAVSNLAYADVLALARVYAAQRNYQVQARQTGELIYGRLFEQGHAGMVRDVASLNTLVGTFWYQECGLLARYDDALAHFEGGASTTPSAEARPPICARVLTATTSR